MAGASPHAGDRAAAGRVPFWVHQLVELLLGMLLLVQGARTGEHTAVLVTLGLLLLLLALCSEGALAAWPWIGRRLHRVLDLVAAAVMALSPLFLGLDHVLPIVILEIAAAAMVWLALRTEWRAPVKPTPKLKLKPEPEPEPEQAPQPAPRPAPRQAPGPEVPLARKVGDAVGKARDDGPRQLGRLVGRAQRAAKAAMAPDPDPPSAAPGGPSEPPGTDPPA
ncbi:MAG TPA: hypothetical protein VGN59_08670 [Acidimicrobiia bacterium]|jgi:hypothetical protein